MESILHELEDEREKNKQLSQLLQKRAGDPLKQSSVESSNGVESDAVEEAQEAIEDFDSCKGTIINYCSI